MYRPFSNWLMLGCILMCFLTLAPQARGEVFHTARTLKPSSLSLGLEPQVYLRDPAAYVLNIHGGIGISSGADLGLHYSLPLNDSAETHRFGADVELGLLKDAPGTPALSIAVGAHTVQWNSFYLDVTLMVSKVLRRVEPYLALDVDVSLPPSVIRPYFTGVGGINVHLSHSTEFMLELGLGINDAPSYLSLGLNFYF